MWRAEGDERDVWSDVRLPYETQKWTGTRGSWDL